MTTTKKILNGTKRAALYCRVSTVEQGKADFSSLDAQEQMLREYCVQKNWIIYKVYTDIKTGATIERPELDALLRDAEEHRFDVIIATKLDRLSRSVKDFLALDERLHSLQIDIVVTTQLIDTTTPAGIMQRTIMLAFAQFEREMTMERTRESIYIRAQKGFWIGGNVPLGYNLENKKLIINKEEAKLVHRIYNTYLEIPSTKALTRKINNEGFRTKVRTTKVGKIIGGQEFTYQSIHDILRNRIYTGFIKINKEIFKGLHEKIIDETLFDKVQNRLDQSSTDTFATYENSSLLLLGTTKCGFCGANLTTYFTNNGKNNTKHFYYKCTTIIKRGSEKCPSRLVPALALESFAQNLMIHTASNNVFFEAITSQIKDNSDNDIAQFNEERMRFNGNLSTIEKKIEMLLQNFSSSILTEETKILLQRNLDELQKQKLNVQTHLAKLDIQINQLKNEKFDKGSLNHVLREFESLCLEAPNDIRRQLLKTIISEIKITAKRGENTGQIEFKLRGNGTLLKNWNDIVTQKGAGLSPRVEWLQR